jgi:succinoglycan biosynthesis transport protein ExoP
MDLADYARVIWKWLWLIVLSVAVASFFSFLATRNQPPSYQAKTTLMVGQVLQEQEPTQTDIWLAQSLAQTYSEIARRQPVQDATKQALGLSWLPEYTVGPVANTQLLEIRVVDTDPQRAAAVANELANQIILKSPTSPRPEQEQRQQFVQQQLDDLEANINDTKAEIQKLQDALAGMFSAREIANAQSQIAALQQKLNTYQANYGQLLQFMGKGVVNTINVVEPAMAPTTPIGPNKLMTVLLAAAIGLVLAVSAAFLLEYLDDTIKTPEDVTKMMSLTTLGAISRIPGEKLAEKLITVAHPKAPVSEAYRVLRTNLQFSSLDKPLKTLVVTSPNPTEGKSTTVANLGVVMAQAGKAVILVDADLRRPILHRIFGVENREGLTDVLLDETPNLDGHLKPTGVENLLLLNTGSLPPNPSELLGSQRMGALIERLKEQADVVLFDSPPSLAVTDASVLATQTDGVLVVADVGRTRRSFARQGSEQLRQVGANLVGVVLNRLKPGRGGYYYYYYYYYYGDRRRRRRGLRRWLPWLPGGSKR